MNSKNYHFLYNPFQANYFIQNGIEILEINKGSKGDIYYKFLKTEESQKVMQRWIDRNKK